MSKKEKKQSKGPAGIKEKELKKLEKKLKLKKFLKNISGIKAAGLGKSPKEDDPDKFDMDKTIEDMKMPPDPRSKKQKIKDFKASLLNKGGIVKKYKGGLMVKPKAGKRGY